MPINIQHDPSYGMLAQGAYNAALAKAAQAQARYEQQLAIQQQNAEYQRQAAAQELMMKQAQFGAQYGLDQDKLAATVDMHGMDARQKAAQAAMQDATARQKAGLDYQQGIYATDMGLTKEQMSNEAAAGVASINGQYGLMRQGMSDESALRQADLRGDYDMRRTELQGRQNADLQSQLGVQDIDKVFWELDAKKELLGYQQSQELGKDKMALDQARNSGRFTPKEMEEFEKQMLSKWGGVNEKIVAGADEEITPIRVGNKMFFKMPTGDYQMADAPTEWESIPGAYRSSDGKIHAKPLASEYTKIYNEARKSDPGDPKAGEKAVLEMAKFYNDEETVNRLTAGARGCTGVPVTPDMVEQTINSASTLWRDDGSGALRKEEISGVAKRLSAGDITPEQATTTINRLMDQDEQSFPWEKIAVISMIAQNDPANARALVGSLPPISKNNWEEQTTPNGKMNVENYLDKIGKLLPNDEGGTAWKNALWNVYRGGLTYDNWASFIQDFGLERYPLGADKASVEDALSKLSSWMTGYIQNPKEY